MKKIEVLQERFLARTPTFLNIENFIKKMFKKTVTLKIIPLYLLTINIKSHIITFPEFFFSCFLSIVIQMDCHSILDIYTTNN